MTVMELELPIPLEGLIALASSHHGPEGHVALPTTGARGTEAHDHLRDPDAAAAWLRERREFAAPSGGPTADELHALREIRAALRDLAHGDVSSYERRTDRLLRAATFRIERLALRPTGAGWARFAAAFLPALVAAYAERGRVKRCANQRCGWIFVDRSAAHSRRWCDMNACGNRIKARRFRARHRRAGRGAGTAA